MCFRPSEASAGPLACPECGKALQAIGGITPKSCPFCKAKLETEAAAPTAPAAGKTPPTPGAPKPGAPKPGGPKVPGAPPKP